ncbi:MAG: hypothetical protein ACOCP8_04425 [archaeon]
MAEKIVQERYQEYRNTLAGKHEADQFLKVFKQEKNDNIKYSSIFCEQEKHWVINITKIEIKQASGLWLRDWEDQDVMSKITSHSLYMHKYKNLVVIKSGIACSEYNKIVNDNVRYNFISHLRKLGYSKYEFKNNIKPLYDHYGTMNIKILIPKNKTSDDLVKLINMVEKFNDYLFNINLSTLQDKNDHNKIVKFKIEI